MAHTEVLKVAISFMLSIVWIAVLPGSFDPPTYGHLNLIHRAAAIFDRLHVVIAVNPNKGYLFSGEERVEMIRGLVAENSNVEVHAWDRLIVKFVASVGADIIVRGVRAFSDFGYEFELAMTNKTLLPGTETIFIPTDPKYFVLRSSAIKEIAAFGGEIESMVPESVASRIRERIEMSGKQP